MADQNAIAYWILVNRLQLFNGSWHFDDKSENSTLRNKKMVEPKWPTKN